MKRHIIIQGSVHAPGAEAVGNRPQAQLQIGAAGGKSQQGHARESQVEVWPLPLDPWLPASERRRARLGPASESCPPLQTQDTAPLVLSGIRDGAVIKRLPGEARVMLPLQTSGGEGRRWWFINGDPLEAAGARTTLMLDKPGEWQLVVMDEAGQTAAASFTLQ